MQCCRDVLRSCCALLQRAVAPGRSTVLLPLTVPCALETRSSSTQCSRAHRCARGGCSTCKIAAAAVPGSAVMISPRCAIHVVAVCVRMPSLTRGSTKAARLPAKDAVLRASHREQNAVQPQLCDSSARRTVHFLQARAPTASMCSDVSYMRVGCAGPGTQRMTRWHPQSARECASHRACVPCRAATARSCKCTASGGSCI